MARYRLMSRAVVAGAALAAAFMVSPHAQSTAPLNPTATLLQEAGEDLKVISERLGHSSIRVTADLYSHVSAKRQKAAADRLDGLLRRPPAGETAAPAAEPESFG